LKRLATTNISSSLASLSCDDDAITPNIVGFYSCTPLLKEKFGALVEMFPFSLFLEDVANNATNISSKVIPPSLTGNPCWIFDVINLQTTTSKICIKRYG
jgi:hypothetical protein